MILSAEALIAMKNQKKKHEGLFTPLRTLFLVALLVALIYGVVRYFVLKQNGTNLDALYRVLWETIPLIVVILLTGLATAILLKQIVSLPVDDLIKTAKRLASDVSENRKVQAIEARGKLGKLGEVLAKQPEEISELLQDTERQVAQETEARVRTSLAQDIYKDAVPLKISFEGSGFGISAQVIRASFTCADYVDSFLLDSQTVFFAIGDVWGKGLSAARTVLKLKNELRAGILSGKPLGEIIYELNRKLYFENKGSLAVTLFAGVFRSDSGELRFVNMGHGSPVVMGFQTGFLRMKADSALGINEQIAVGEASFILHPGQGLVLGTRGVTDVKNAEGKAFGLDCLLAASRLHTGSPYAAEGILHSVKEYLGEPIEDDLAVLALQYIGASTRMPASPAAAADMREDSEGIYRALLQRSRGER